jgi:hypothetical protein
MDMDYGLLRIFRNIISTRGRAEHASKSNGGLCRRALTSAHSVARPLTESLSQAIERLTRHGRFFTADTI